MKRVALFLVLGTIATMAARTSAMIPEQVKIDTGLIAGTTGAVSRRSGCSKAFRLPRRRSARTAGGRRSRRPSGTACARPTPSARRARPGPLPGVAAVAAREAPPVHPGRRQRPRRSRAGGSQGACAQRGLPVGQRLDQRQGRRRSPAGHGVDLRRRLHRRIRRPAVVRRRESGRQGSGHRDVQLPPRLARVLRPSGTGEGIRTQRLRQLRDDGRDRRAAVGEAEHQRVRRRSEQRHGRRRIGRRDHGRRAGRLAAGQGAVQPRHRPERRLDGADNGPDALGRHRPGGRRQGDGGAGRQDDRRAAREAARRADRAVGGRPGRRRLPHSRRSVVDVPERQAERRRRPHRIEQGRSQLRRLRTAAPAWPDAAARV